MSKEDSLVNKLRLLKHLLKEDVWTQKTFFYNKNGKLCMCPHGAAQVVSNPRVKEVYKDYQEHITNKNSWQHRRKVWDFISLLNQCKRLDVGCAASDGHRYLNGSLSKWRNQSDWIKSTTSTLGYGNLEVHYILGMVGLTVEFNDSSSTTFPMIQQKIDQAIVLAKILETY